MKEWKRLAPRRGLKVSADTFRTEEEGGIVVLGEYGGVREIVRMSPGLMRVVGWELIEIAGWLEMMEGQRRGEIGG